MAMSDWLTIDGVWYDVVVTEISENASILYSSNTGRTVAIGAPMVLDPLGTFIGHNITVKPKKSNPAAFDALFEKLIQPIYDGVYVKAVHGQKTISYQAYVSAAERAVKRIDDEKNIVYWQEMSINIVPMEAQITP